jgi:hypothetical protein
MAETQIPVSIVNHFGHRAQVVAIYQAQETRSGSAEYHFIRFELIEQKRRGRKPGRPRKVGRPRKAGGPRKSKLGTGKRGRPRKKAAKAPASA